MLGDCANLDCAPVQFSIFCRWCHLQIGCSDVCIQGDGRVESQEELTLLKPPVDGKQLHCLHPDKKKGVIGRSRGSYSAAFFGIRQIGV